MPRTRTGAFDAIDKLTSRTASMIGQQLLGPLLEIVIADAGRREVVYLQQATALIEGGCDVEVRVSIDADNDPIGPRSWTSWAGWGDDGQAVLHSNWCWIATGPSKRDRTVTRPVAIRLLSGHCFGRPGHLPRLPEKRQVHSEDPTLSGSVVTRGQPRGQARRTRACPDEATTASRRASLMSQRAGLTDGFAICFHPLVDG